MRRRKVVPHTTPTKGKGSRPYKIDYGMSAGHTADGMSAVLSGLRYLKKNGMKHTVIEQPHGPPIDVWWNGVFGVVVRIRGAKSKTPKLRRVA